MAGRQYSDAKNPFFSVEEPVSDDDFLRHPKQGSSGYMFPGHQSGSHNPLEDRRLQLQEERRKIEQRTLDSSSRSVGLLQESERAGIETAEELIRQREQLENTERRLDDINSTLNVSQRHISNIKSVFSSLKSYFGSRGAATADPARPAGAGAASVPQSSSDSRLQQTLQRTEAAAADRPSQPHPGLRMRGLDDEALSTPAAADPYARVDAQLDRNLEDMCSGLTRLRGLAEGLGDEISEQNDMLDRISKATDRADLRVTSQNKDMVRILKK
ncbi:synaptosomal-associated protein 29-like [Pollicipes pollicipes]|uniref:synaptosomal-associated protein 29-like n=1 Tax=Pollicipes pollicipes TaxID=41117 RepID=UPI001884A50E|nr:synaptosomal-associated protein 29-like [Pollicipes pollicipes]XP_037090333.1 synaptosomal-associated protein 29-like [Pollicipes pollicipes]